MFIRIVVLVIRSNLVMVGPNKLDHLDTAALTGRGWWHVVLKQMKQVKNRVKRVKTGEKQGKTGEKQGEQVKTGEHTCTLGI